MRLHAYLVIQNRASVFSVLRDHSRDYTASWYVAAIERNGKKYRIIFLAHCFAYLSLICKTVWRKLVSPELGLNLFL